MSDPSDAVSPPPRVPPGVRLYAVGDVHGRDDLLDDMLGRIAADAAGRSALVIHLGDYVDRGSGTPRVLDRLCTEASHGLRTVFLKGNHDDVMLRFLDDISVGPHWLRLGGLATLAAYGIARPSQGNAIDRLLALQDAVRKIVPSHHIAFLQSLRLHECVGDYLFVHAGIRPGVPLDQQSERDLLWIRQDFLDSDAAFGKVIVHGHTIAEKPVVRPNRIGIDTGAFATGRLSCLVLEDDRRWFLSTG